MILALEGCKTCRAALYCMAGKMWVVLSVTCPRCEGKNHYSLNLTWCRGRVRNTVKCMFCSSSVIPLSGPGSIDAYRSLQNLQFMKKKHRGSKRKRRSG